ncbi:hypothetical protein [Bacillus cereus]|uniref:Uncharacterized protein n=1 Tax=Bacillus cereus TaxID=1396 RepID=A0A2B9D5M2_BACCE|nr:hypothetical protein [Bacillus cereus]PGM87988.1 hypothetical protein CN958_27790 [Bacillus cereus]
MSEYNIVTTERYISNKVTLESTDKTITDESNMLTTLLKGASFGDKKVYSTDGDLLLILEDLKVIIIDPGADCNDFVTVSGKVQTTGWKTAAFPSKFLIYIDLFDKNGTKIYRCAGHVISECKYNYIFAFEEEISFDIFNEAEKALPGWDSKVKFMRCV